MSITHLLAAIVTVSALFPRETAGEATGDQATSVLQEVAGLAVNFRGPVQDRLERITRSWLITAPDANPAMLAMFRDRDRLPYRDLLPWSGEFAGKYVTGATEVLNSAESEELEAVLAEFVKDLVLEQAEDGYLGPFPRGSRLTGQAPNAGEKGGPTWDAWGHYHVMLGLILWHERSGSEEALRAARRIGDLLCERFLGEGKPRLVDTGSTEMNLAPAHGLCLLYRISGEARYLELAKKIVGEFEAVDDQGRPLAGDYLRMGLAGKAFYQLPKPRWESIHPVLALAELWRITGEERYREAFSNLWWSIAELDRHNNGGFSSGEQAQGNPYHPGAIETCCTIAWMAMSVEMLKLSGLSVVADELELSTLNSAVGLYHPSGRWSTYNTPMDGVRKASMHDIVFQSRPGSPELNCCSVNAARGLGMLHRWALMRNPEGLALNWYGPATYRVSAEGVPEVSLRVDNDYPREPKAFIHIELKKPARFTLALRVPHWSDDTTIQVNGVAVEEVKPGTYLPLSRLWNPGDVVSLSFDFGPRFWVGERECAGRSSIYYGPLLLAFERHHQPLDPDSDDPILDAKGLDLKRAEMTDGEPSLVEFETGASSPTSTSSPTSILLRDFASAGASGCPYRTWLRVEDVQATPFDRGNPLRTRKAVAASP